MKSYTTRRTLLLLGIVSALVAPAAQAQFPGDVFFAEPSVAAPQGGTATLEVLLFSGTQAVGATHFEVLFDADDAEVVAVEAGSTEELAPGQVSVTKAGRISVVSLNGSSLTRPFGTASLARLRIRPLVPPGSRVSLDLEVRSLLKADSTPFPESEGFAGEILVVSAVRGNRTSLPGVGASDAVDPGEAGLGDQRRRARAFRRPGQAVELLELRTLGGETSVVPHRMVVPDPTAPSETPRF